VQAEQNRRSGYLKNNAQVIDSLVVAYNSHDARAFADHFSENAWHGNLHADTFQEGREAIFQRYVEVFARFPQNRTEVLHRIVVGDYVIDHERVRRSASMAAFDVVAVYTVKQGQITRLEMIRE
jgi:hypothetical protein